MLVTLRLEPTTVDPAPHRVGTDAEQVRRLSNPEHHSHTQDHSALHMPSPSPSCGSTYWASRARRIANAFAIPERRRPAEQTPRRLACARHNASGSSHSPAGWPVFSRTCMMYPWATTTQWLDHQAVVLSKSAVGPRCSITFRLRLRIAHRLSWTATTS